MNTTPSAEKNIRVYNRGSRSFIHGEHKIAGASFAEVPPLVAKNWMRLFPDDVIEAGIAQKELGGLGAELVEVRTKLTAAESRIKELDTALARKVGDPKGEKAKADLAVAQARVIELEGIVGAANLRIAALESDLERATAPAPAADAI